MNQQTFLLFKKNKTDKEVGPKPNRHIFWNLGSGRMEGLFLLGFPLVQMKLYYKASLLRLLDELL